MRSSIRVGLIGDLNEQQKAHQAIPKALHAASGGDIEAVWIPTDGVGNTALMDFDGFWCVPGMPYRNAAGAMQAIRHARVTGTPFLGTSAGFQYAVLEFARNALGFMDADHQKSNPKAAIPLISPLGCALAGVKARVHFSQGSLIRKAYNAGESVEEYHCSFGLNGKYLRLLEGSQFCVSAVDDQHEIRAFELDGHPFFVATLFQPEMRSLADASSANPIVHAFVSHCGKRARGVARVAS